MTETIYETIKDSDGVECFIKRGNLVRCKDCKHGDMLCADYVSCIISEENESGCHVSHKPDWFCADGERR